jgi:methyl-accepting chemotaxis protein
MMKRVRSMTLGQKLFGAFGVMILLMVAVAGVSQAAFVRSAGGFQALLKTVERRVERHAAAAEATMLQCRRHEKDFLLRLDNKYVEKHADAMAELLSEAESIQNLTSEAGMSEQSAAAGQVVEYAKEYGEAFQQLVATWERCGLDEESGLQGRFRDSVHDLEEKLGQYQVEDLYRIYLQCRRQEAVYLRSRSEEDRAVLAGLLENYRERLAASVCAEAVKRAQETPLSTYGELLGRMAAADAEAEDVLAEQLRDAADELETMLAQVDIPDSARVLLMVRRHEKDYLMRLTDKYIQRTNDRVEELRQMCHASQVGPTDLQEIDGLLDAYLADFNALVAENTEIANLTGRMRDAVHKIEPAVAGIAEQSRESAAEKAVATTALTKSLSLVSLSLSGLAILSAAVLALWLVTTTKRDLGRILRGLSAGSEQTSTAANQVSGSSQVVAQGATEQAASVEETTSSVEEMTAMIKQTASNALEAKQLAERAQEDAEQGGQAMRRMSDAIDDIKRGSDETAKIVKSIDEIAFQTNLLALNAAVEAARAGEAGKGFAVVAEEVRNLAQRAGEAARSTSELIETSVKNADNGVQISQEVAESLTKIGTGSRQVNELINEIASAGKEQAQGVEQINNAVAQMDRVIQSSAANAEESASFAEELSAQAEALGELVQALQLVVGKSGRHDESLRSGATRATKRVQPSLAASDESWHDISRSRETAEPMESEAVRH